MIYRAQRYEQAYDRIPLGMPFTEAGQATGQMGVREA
jgi:hypothetical protein